MTCPPPAGAYHWLDSSIFEFNFKCLSELTIINKKNTYSHAYEVYQAIMDSRGNEMPLQDSHTFTQQGAIIPLLGFYSRYNIYKQRVAGRYYYCWDGKYYFKTIPSAPALRDLGIRNWEQVFPYGGGK